jgi:hypothetical protein
MHQLKGLNGVAYACSSSKNTYCDDWYTDPYKPVFNDSNNLKSLHHAKKLGFNLIRTYYLDPNRNHDSFLNTCTELKLSVEIGISNNLLDNRDVASIQKLVNSIKHHKCIKIYTIGNEYFNSIDNIIFGLELVYSLDPNRYYMHSSIFDHQFQSAKNIYVRIPNYIKEKYIVGLNVYFYNNKAETHGDVLQNVLADYYNDSILKESYLNISEFGNQKEDEQWASLWNFSWGNSVCLKKYPKYLGYELFSYANESWKGNNHGENNYGILTEDGMVKAGYHAIAEYRKSSGYTETIKPEL